jgi:hypothetical protein
MENPTVNNEPEGAKPKTPTKRIRTPKKLSGRTKLKFKLNKPSIARERPAFDKHETITVTKEEANEILKKMKIRVSDDTSPSILQEEEMRQDDDVHQDADQDEKIDINRELPFPREPNSVPSVNLPKNSKEDKFPVKDPGTIMEWIKFVEKVANWCKARKMNGTERTNFLIRHLDGDALAAVVQLDDPKWKEVVQVVIEERFEAKNKYFLKKMLEEVQLKDTRKIGEFIKDKERIFEITDPDISEEKKIEEYLESISLSYPDFYQILIRETVRADATSDFKKFKTILMREANLVSLTSTKKSISEASKSADPVDQICAIGKPELKCYSCGQIGHKKFQCKKKVNETPKQNSQQNAQQKRKAYLKRKLEASGDDEIQCYNCSGYGHKANQCSSPSRQKKKTNTNDSNVNKDSSCYDDSLLGPDDNIKIILHNDVGRSNRRIIIKRNKEDERPTTAQVNAMTVRNLFKKNFDRKNGSRSTLTITTDINGKKTITLLDSGARVNAVDEKYLLEIIKSKSNMQSCENLLTAANNTSLDVRGKIRLNVGIKDGNTVIEYRTADGEMFIIDDLIVEKKEKIDITERINSIEENINEEYIPECVSWGLKDLNIFSAEFIVVKDLAVPILIGWPTMEDMGAIIDSREGSVRFLWKNGLQEYETKVFYRPKTSKKTMIPIYTVKEVTIQPNTVSKVYIKGIEEELAEIQPVSLIPGLSAEGVIDKNCQFIFMENPTDNKITVKENAPILLVKEKELQKIEEDYIIGTIGEDGVTFTDEFNESLNKALANGKLLKNEQARLRSLILEYKNRFKKEMTADVLNSKDKPYELKLSDVSQPVIQNIGRLSPEKHRVMEEMAENLHKRNLIEESDGAWRSRVVLVPKKDGGLRTTIDYRKVNELILPDSYPMPRTDEILDNLHGAKYFSKLDMTDGFWQIALAEDSRDYTGFVTRSKFWRWKVLPMGLKSSPSVFQRKMDCILGEIKWKFVMCYLDDLIIYSKTFEEHMDHIKQVLEKLELAGMFVKLSKCAFGMESIDFLGHIVTKEGIKPDPKKTKAIAGMTAPTDAHGVRRFLGMASFYRRYIKDFAARTEGMRNLIHKDTIFKWTLNHDKEFEDIKKELISNPVMAYPNFREKFILATDASHKGLGAVLSQKYPDGERVVAYASRSLTKGEKGYGITQLEALAVVWAVNQFKVYLQDHKFTLITDHRALVKFKELKDTNPLLERWSIKLSPYDYDVEYRPGKDHHNADCPSRTPVDLILSIDIDEFVDMQKNDEEIKAYYEKSIKKGIVNFVIDEKREVFEEREYVLNPFESYVVKNDNRLWYRNTRMTRGKCRESFDRLCIPRKMIPEILQLTHNPNHFGFKKTLDKVKEKFWWPKLNKDTFDYCNTCKECAARNTPKGFNSRGKIQKIEVSRKFELIGIDLCNPGPATRPGGYQHILVATDYATKWTMCVPVMDKEAKTLADALWEHWICYFGCPERIISDNGGEFIGDDIVKELMELMKIKHHTTTSYHPRANGQVERFNKTMANMLAKKLTDKTQVLWHKYLSTIALEYNCTRHSATGETPFFLVYGQEPHMPLDELLKLDISKKYDIDKWRKEGIPVMKERMRFAIKGIKEAQTINADRRNQRLKEIRYAIGDKVLIREEPRTNRDAEVHKKLKSPWIGPFTIDEWQHSENLNVYQVSRKLKSGELDKRVVNVKNIKKLYERPKWLKGIDMPKEQEELDIEERFDPRDKEYIPEESIDETEEVKIPEEMIVDKPIEKPITNAERPPTVVSRTNTRPSRTNTDIPTVGTLVDVKFVLRDGKKNQKLKPFSCGTVTEVHEKDIYIKFLDGEEGWFTIGNKPGNLNRGDIRECVESKTHIRSDIPTSVIVTIKETDEEHTIHPKGSKVELRKRKSEEGSRSLHKLIKKKKKLVTTLDKEHILRPELGAHTTQSMNVHQLTEHPQGRFGTSLLSSVNANSLTSAPRSLMNIKIDGTPISIEMSNVNDMMEVIKRLKES